MNKMNKDERINAVLNKEPVDRIPVSFWRHFYEHEDTPRGLAGAMLDFQADYDWDYMKVNPRASYHTEDWGTAFKFFKDGHTKPERIDYPIKKINDLEKIKPLDPLKSKVLKDHIDALHYIKKGLDKHTYFVMTVFTPLSILGDMAETRDILKDYMMEDPKLVKSALDAITVTFSRFINELLNVGVSGIFYATTHWGTYDRITDEIFDEYSRPWDLKILKIVENCPFNILHVCKSHNMLKRLSDYPVNAINWDSRDDSNPGLSQGLALTGKTVIGGIDQKHTMMNSPDSAIAEARESMDQTGAKQWILGAGCTFSPSVPSDCLKVLREWVDRVPIIK